MKKLFALMLVALFATTSAFAQRKTDKIDRGVVAVPSGTGTLVSWRIFGEEYYDTRYNVYFNGTKVNSAPLSASNFLHASTAAGSYQVEAVVRGQSQGLSAAAKRWSGNYLDIPVAGVTDRDGNDVTSEYVINDISLGDVNGDGVVEFIVKRNYSGDILSASNTTKFHHLECYTMAGERLWWIDCGPNLMAGADEQWDIVAYDWDGDGKAETLMRGADNMYIHTASGKTIAIGSATYVAPRTEYTRDGAEYLLYMEGATGEPYGWDGTSSQFTPMAYPLPRFESGESDYATVWGKNDTGHRSAKHYFGAPFLDGRHASIFLGRGCYTRHKMCALDVDPATHELKQRWRWNEYSASSPWFGQGYHNFSIADVDWDGRDEIMFGSMVIDDNGKGLCTTGLGHGDAQHCADLDPYRHGQEQFVCNETSPACTYFNATTGKIYYRLKSSGDDGRALCANFTNDYPGSLGRSTQTGYVSTVADKTYASGVLPDAASVYDALYWSHLNFRIYWDGDLCDEVLDSPGTEREAAVYKPFGGRIFTSSGCNMNNWSKNNPAAMGDILGDWREEIVVRADGNTKIRIYTTDVPTEHRVYTLWHDHQYRNAMVWQSVGYNQPPHKSYFLGEMEGITTPPPPLTMTGRVEIANGGTIGAGQKDEHVIVCETNDTKISVADGASPYIATFNVPSHVTGNGTRDAQGVSHPTEKYFTCTVSGGAFTGGMRLVKQGDGILTLPGVEQKHTGNTDIWAGTLNFDGKLKNSRLWLNRFTELNSSGGEFRSIHMDYASKLRPGGADARGEVTTDTLVLGFGARLVIDIYNDLTADKVTAKSLTVGTKDWAYGPQYLTPVVEIVPHLAEGESVAVGKYLIAEAGSVGGSLGSIKIEGLSTDVKAALEQEGNKIYLVVSSLRDPSSVIWNGNESNTWNMGGAKNFTSALSPEVTDEVFVTGDKVLFDDNAAQTDVMLSDDIEADSVIVDNSKAYTFGGTGSIVGSSTLVKRGSSTLTISTDNAYTGGTRISGGTVRVASLSNENQAKGGLGGVTTAASKFIIENGAVLQTTAAVTQGSPMQILTEEGGVINNSADFSTSKAISGTLLTKRGTGWMKLNVGNPSLTKLTIAAGTVVMNGHNTPAKNVEFQGGTLSETVENVNSTYALSVPAEKKGTWNLCGRASYANALTGEGELTVYIPSYLAPRTRITGNWSKFTGTVKATAASNTAFTFDNSNGLPNATLDVSSGVTVMNSSGKTFAIGKVTGDAGALGGVVSFSQTGASGNATWKLGNDTNWSWKGRITGTAALTKAGTGKMSLGKGSSDNDYSGATRVDEGELHFSSGALLGTGALTVQKGATLSGTTSGTGLTNSSTTVNGTLQAGITASGTSGIMNFGGKNVTFSQTGVLRLGINKAATSSSRGGASIGNINQLTMNGTVSLFYSPSFSPNVGDSIVIWDAKTFSGSPTLESEVISLEKGLYWDTSRLKEGLLFVTDVVPTGIQGLAADTEVGVQVVATNGAVVDEYTTAFGEAEAAFRRSSLPAGVYMLRITGGSETMVKKVRK